MRALWTLLVVCFVAAAGVRPVEAEGLRACRADHDREAAALLRNAPTNSSVVKNSTESQRYVATNRSARQRARIDDGAGLAPVVVAVQLVVHAPERAVVVVETLHASCDVAGVELGSCSARGPPVA